MNGTEHMKQITIVAESSAGLLTRVPEILAGCGINIETLDAETSQAYGGLTDNVQR